jgi:RecA-family ATPase
MIELPVSEALAKAEADRMTRALCHAALKKSIMGIDPEKALSQDDQCSAVRSLAACERLLAPFEYAALLEQIAAAKAQLAKRTAWRIEGTLREFERFAPVNVWFDYPVHVADRAGVLGDIDLAREEQRKKREIKAAEQQARKEENDQQRNAKIENAIQLHGGIGTVTTTDIYQYFSGQASKSTIQRWLRAAGYRGDSKPPYLIQRMDS